jgi:hypothetical protein
LGIWMIGIDFELKQNWQSIMQSGSCELKVWYILFIKRIFFSAKTTNSFLSWKWWQPPKCPRQWARKSWPYIRSTIIYLFFELCFSKLQKCNCSWESLEKAVIKIDQGKGKIPKISYTLRVGYIENSTNQLFEKFVKVISIYQIYVPILMYMWSAFLNLIGYFESTRYFAFILTWQIGIFRKKLCLFFREKNAVREWMRQLENYWIC